MIVVNRFVGGDDEFAGRAEAALGALGACRGFVRGRLGRAIEPAADGGDLWCLVTEWESVGAYRRALSTWDVKLHGTPLLAQSVDEPAAYEVLGSLDAGGELAVSDSDRHDETARG